MVESEQPDPAMPSDACTPVDARRVLIDYAREIPTHDGVRTDFGTIAVNPRGRPRGQVLHSIIPGAVPLSDWAARKQAETAYVDRLYRGRGDA